jgi:predicted O-methyltransferase YrrM
MIPTLVIDSTQCPSELCAIGKYFNTDKSPYNIGGHRHPYTAVYSMLLSQYKTTPVKFAEIGVAGGASVLMWNCFFENGSFFFYDRDENFLSNAKRLVGSNNTFSLMNVNEANSIREALALSKGELDVLLDDSSHNIDDQKRIIEVGVDFVRSGGMIIIEDIDRGVPNEDYFNIIKKIKDKFSFITFIMTEHENRYSPGYDNDKLLVLIKK